MSKHYLAFGSLFFLRHQGLLLWLLNSPVIRWWFRRVLRVHGDCSSVGGRRITRILPNAIFWWDGPHQKAEFRTHAKFSKRLYHAFKPVWWAMHVWDWAFSDRWVPKLSFGFSTLTKYPDADTESATVDGNVKGEDGTGTSTWAQIIGRSGDGFDDSSAASEVCEIVEDSGGWFRVKRGIFLFDTSTLTSGASISAAVLSLYGSGKNDGISITPDVDIYTSNPASNTALEAGDFDSLGAVSQTGSPISYASWNTSGYNDFTLDSTGRGNISKTGISKFGTRNANYDVAESEPSRGYAWAISELLAYMADQAGTTNDPKLVVTYTVASTGQVIMISRSSLPMLIFGGILAAVTRNPKVSRRKFLSGGTK